MRSRRPFALALGASLAGHVVIAVVAIVDRARPPDEPANAEMHAAPLTGESFDIAQTDEPSDEPVSDPSPAIEFPANEPAANAGAGSTGSTGNEAPATDDGTMPAKSTHPATHAADAKAAAKASAAPAPASAGSFGAVGERGAVEIVPFFQRAFVQMASADPAWSNAPFGNAGTTSLSLTIDATGHLSGSTIGSGASAALASSITRTLPLLAHRSFTATGARSVLHLSAHVTKDAVHDGLHGDVFALGVTSSGAGASGTAWFALPSGRRVDLTISAR